MSIKHTTTVDIGDLRTLSKPIHLMQYDKSLPEIEVHITKDGQEYTIPSGYSATIRWGKPDKHGCTATGTVSGSTVTFQVTEQMACVAGRSKVTVEIVESDSSQAGTAKFEVIVDSNPIGDNTIVSDSEIADIQKAIEAGQNAVTASETATAKANEASTSATTASQKAEEASASAQTAAAKANEAKASADSIANVTSDVEKLKEDLPNKITKFYASNQGETHITDSDNGKIQDMMIYGKSSQDGTPTPENPVEINSVVNPTIKFCGKNLLQPNLMYEDRIKINIKKGALLTIICKDGLVSNGGNLRFETAEGDIIWFGFDEGNVKQQIKLGNDVVALDYLINQRLSENYALYIGDGNTYEPYKEQSIQLPITLNAIPVSEGGNVTIEGQQYIADYVDVEHRKVIRNVLKWNLADMIVRGFNNNVWNINISSLGIDGSKIGLSNMFKIQYGDYSKPTISELYIAYDGKTAALNMRGMTDEDFKKWIIEKNPEVYNVLSVAEEIPITTEEASAFKQLMTYYPVTNISVNSEQLEGYTVFNYPISLANGWNYVKQQLNDNRDYIYDMDLQSAEAYVNSEYAVTLTELEV